VVGKEKLKRKGLSVFLALPCLALPCLGWLKYILTRNPYPYPYPTTTLRTAHRQITENERTNAKTKIQKGKERLGGVTDPKSAARCGG
jgi:hypothetical protein